MRSMFLGFAISVLFVFAPTLAAAADGPDWGRSGWYLGAGAGYAWDFFQNDIEDATANLVDIDGSAVLNVRGGYRLTSWFAAEAQYEYVDGFDTKILGETAFTLSTHSIIASAKFILPTWRVQPYINLGIGAQHSVFKDKTGLGLIGDESDWVFVGRPAFGIDFLATDNLVLFMEFAGALAVTEIKKPGQDVNDLWYTPLIAGLTWRF